MEEEEAVNMKVVVKIREVAGSFVISTPVSILQAAGLRLRDSVVLTPGPGPDRFTVELFDRDVDTTDEHQAVALKAVRVANTQACDAIAIAEDRLHNAVFQISGQADTITELRRRRDDLQTHNTQLVERCRTLEAKLGEQQQ